MIPSGVFERARMGRVADFDWSAIPAADRGSRFLELVEWDHTLRSIVPLMLEEVGSPRLHELGQRLASHPAIRSEADLQRIERSLWAELDRLNGADALAQVEDLYSGPPDSPLPDPEAVALAGLEAISITLSSEHPDLSGERACTRSALYHGVFPATLVYFALWAGVPPTDLEDRILEMANEMVETSQQSPGR